MELVFSIPLLEAVCLDRDSNNAPKSVNKDQTILRMTYLDKCEEEPNNNNNKHEEDNKGSNKSHRFWTRFSIYNNVVAIVSEKAFIS